MLEKFVTTIIFLFILQTSFAQKAPYVEDIEFTGNLTLSESRLLKQMNTQERNLVEKITFQKKKEFTYFTLDQDIDRLKEFYQRNGFINPDLSYEVTQKKKKSRKRFVTIEIQEGPIVEVIDVSYLLNGDDEFIKVIDSLMSIAPVKKNIRFRDQDIYATKKLISKHFSSIGYPFVAADHSLEFNPRLKEVSVAFSIDPGNKTFFGNISLQGDSNVSKKFINRNIILKKGDVFSETEMEDQQEKLFDLEVFRYVTIRALMDEVENDRVPLVINVEELPRWSFRAGAGYGTEDRLRISLLLTRLNFFGGGRKLIVKGQRSYFLPVSVDVRFIQPNLFTDKLNLIINPYYSRERERSFLADRLGGSISLDQAFSPRTHGFISYSIENATVDLSDSFESPPEDLDNNKSGITVGVKHDNADNMFFPSSGWKAELTLNYTGIGFNTEVHYYKWNASTAVYLPLGEKVVLAAKLRSGVMEETQGDIQTPIEDRFLLGGAMSMRGYNRNRISPQDAQGNLLGGNTMLESGLEIRFPLVSIFYGAVFMEAGNVWLNPWTYRFDELLYDAGFGIRIKTPVGPVRFDFATPVIEDSFKFQFFLTIGQAF